ncbi:MAG: hypothetical protein VYE22_13795 [Myxococcota bacterium]|nr:hypothetical protein [Myxococcota bacterium]
MGRELLRAGEREVDAAALRVELERAAQRGGGLGRALARGRRALG